MARKPLTSKAFDGLPENTNLCCPHCGCKLAQVPLYRHATNFVTRTCRSRNCGTQWSIKVTPIAYNSIGVLVTENQFVAAPKF